MRRVTYVLAMLGVLCVAATQAQAYGPYHHGGHNNGYYHGGYHHGYYGSVVVPRVYVAPRWVVPAPAVIYPRPLYYRSCYDYPYYAPLPPAGFYYQSRGLSLGIGW
jgi:hypothetical protein